MKWSLASDVEVIRLVGYRWSSSGQSPDAKREHCDVTTGPQVMRLLFTSETTESHAMTYVFRDADRWHSCHVR